MKDYKRLTETSIGCFKYILKDHKPEESEFNDYDAFFDYSMAIKRLGELEDKIERGELDYVADSKTEQTIMDLLIEFDEMGFAPTTVCPDGEKYAIDWRERVRKEFARLTAENSELRHRAEVAERALRNITERASCNICDNFSCRYYEGINYDYNAEDCIKWWLAQAEKELAEERKDD